MARAPADGPTYGRISLRSSTSSLEDSKTDSGTRSILHTLYPQGVPPIGRVACSVINLSLYPIMMRTTQGQSEKDIIPYRHLLYLLIGLTDGSFEVDTSMCEFALTYMEPTLDQPQGLVST